MNNTNNFISFDVLTSEFEGLIIDWVLYVICCVSIAALLIIAPKLLSKKASGFEKLSSYECGFQPFHSSRSYIHINFFVLSILFLIFDLELIYLIPFAVYSSLVGWCGILSVYIFILLVVLGFVYEWKTNMLELKFTSF